MENNGKSYTFLRWNGQYGSGARFVVRDNKTGMTSMFTPGKMNDLTWTKNDLSEMPEVKDWDDFQDETVSNLEDVAF